MIMVADAVGFVPATAIEIIVLLALGTDPSVNAVSVHGDPDDRRMVPGRERFGRTSRYRVVVIAVMQVHMATAIIEWRQGVGC